MFFAIFVAVGAARAGIWVQPVIEDSPMTKKGHLEGGVNGEGVKRADGKTPLMLAVEAGQVDVIEYLLGHGADPSLKDAAGDTAMDIAERLGVKDALVELDGFLAEHPDPDVYYAGKAPRIVISSGSSQTGTPDAGGAESLVVYVSGTDGEPLVDAPVRFAVEGGGQNLLTEASSPDSPTLLMRTGAYGLASANVHIPKTPGKRIRITASAGFGKQVARVTFTAMAADDTHPSDGDSVFNPTDETAALNPDGSIDVTWVNHTEDETSIKVWVRMPGAWKLGADVPAHSTKAHVAPP